MTETGVECFWCCISFYAIDLKELRSNQRCVVLLIYYGIHTDTFLWLPLGYILTRHTLAQHFELWPSPQNLKKRWLLQLKYDFKAELDVPECCGLSVSGVGKITVTCLSLALQSLANWPESQPLEFLGGNWALAIGISVSTTRNVMISSRGCISWSVCLFTRYCSP